MNKQKELMDFYDIDDSFRDDSDLDVKFDYYVEILTPMAMTVYEKSTGPITFFIDAPQYILIDTKNNIINFVGRNFDIVIIRIVNADSWQSIKFKENKNFILSIMEPSFETKRIFSLKSTDSLK